MRKRAIMVSRHLDVIDHHQPERGRYVLTLHMDCVYPFMYEERQWHDVTEITAHHVHGTRLGRVTHTVSGYEREMAEFPWLEIAIDRLALKMERVIMEEYR